MGEGEPLVCDFGITRISDEIDEDVTSKTMAPGGNVKHRIPELTETNGVSTTKHSDTYWFVMLCSNLLRKGSRFYALTTMPWLFTRGSAWWSVRPDQTDVIRGANSRAGHGN